MQKDKISVLMCAYNAADYIGQAIQSIIDQTYTNWELLISDDFSTDSTFQIAQAYAQKDARIKLFKQPENLGYLLNTNFIWNKAEGQFITFQDADDWSSVDRLIKQSQFLINNEVDICSSNFSRVDLIGKNKSIGEIEDLPSLSYNFIYQHFVAKRTLPVFAGTLFLNRKVLNSVGTYNPFFSRKCGEDTDWILRASRDFKIGTMSNILYYYRENPKGVTQNLTVDKLINYTLILKIHENFIKTGADLLDTKNQAVLLTLEKALKKPFLLDNSKIYYEQVKNSIYHKNWKSALKKMLRAIRAKPFHIPYYKTLFFIIRNFDTEKH